LLYALVIVRLDRRDLVWINVTTNPTAEWIARQITEAFPWDDAPQHLIRDRDRIYGTIVMRRLRTMGIRDKPTAPASPWQNGFAERLIGSIRRECVDHFVVLGEAHLRRILRAYARYYNDIRTHRSLDKDARSLARFSGPESLVHTRSLADFITTTSGFRFSVHTLNGRRNYCDRVSGWSLDNFANPTQPTLSNLGYLLVSPLRQIISRSRLTFRSMAEVNSSLRECRFLSGRLNLIGSRFRKIQRNLSLRN
jgi:hypothetical protein